mmetsp:Transcript_5839/g.16121  ORF Transcript_5839/g.16121 Transcript_5839/m.16121 type:complete len:287 (+) Transcript_5839:883-1743(+)
MRKQVFRISGCISCAPAWRRGHHHLRDWHLRVRELRILAPAVCGTPGRIDGLDSWHPDGEATTTWRRHPQQSEGMVPTRCTCHGPCLAGVRLPAQPARLRVDLAWQRGHGAPPAACHGLACRPGSSGLKLGHPVSAPRVLRTAAPHAQRHGPLGAGGRRVGRARHSAESGPPQPQPQADEPPPPAVRVAVVVPATRQQRCRREGGGPGVAQELHAEVVRGPQHGLVCSREQPCAQPPARGEARGGADVQLPLRGSWHWHVVDQALSWKRVVAFARNHPPGDRVRLR